MTPPVFKLTTFIRKYLHIYYKYLHIYSKIYYFRWKNNLDLKIDPLAANKMKGTELVFTKSVFIWPKDKLDA